VDGRKFYKSYCSYKNSSDLTAASGRLASVRGSAGFSFFIKTNAES